MEFLFRRRYNLPPTDPRFLAATREEIAVDVLAWHYFEHPDDGEVVDDGFDVQAELAAADAEAGEPAQGGDSTLPDDFEDV